MEKVAWELRVLEINKHDEWFQSQEIDADFVLGNMLIMPSRVKNGEGWDVESLGCLMKKLIIIEFIALGK